MKLRLITPEDFAKAVHEQADGHCFNALDTQTLQGMRTVTAVFTAQASNGHGQFILELRKGVGSFPPAVEKTEFPAARERAVALEKQLKDLGLTLSYGMWTL